MEAEVKKYLMIGATLTMGSAAVAQSGMAVLNEHGAVSGYPACSGEVTDSCIQLYERGVDTSANLALNVHSGVAVGGPYEPVTEHMASTMSHEGMGGPIEERTSYPPCDPGPGDDNCIQLYEPGVTGAGK